MNDTNEVSAVTDGTNDYVFVQTDSIAEQSAASDTQATAHNAHTAEPGKFTFSVDFARVSYPIDQNGIVNGWMATVLGMFVVISCLVIIATIIANLPKVLAFFNKMFPENSDKNTKPAENTASQPEAAEAAAVAVAYHNYHNDGK